MTKPDSSTRAAARPSARPIIVEADICVVGSGAAGISAALEAVRLGRRVVLVEAAPTLGGQAVNSVIGTFCGLYSNGPEPYRVTHGIADDILGDLAAAGAAAPRRGRNTVIVQYDEVVLARWVEESVRRSDITPLLGATLRNVVREGRRIAALELATRYGDVSVRAGGFVDASGDAALCWLAGYDLQEPTSEVFGTQMIVLEGMDDAALARIDRRDMEARLREKADDYGLRRRDGFVFAFPGRGTAIANMTHMSTPLDPVGMSRAMLDGRAQADALLKFLRAEFPEALGDARIRHYGLPGIRQTRWIRGATRLTIDDVRAGTRFDDAIARCSWPVELHQDEKEVYWQEFGDDHMHFVPFGSLTPKDADNVVAAGRCVDADAAALSTIRVMGPCMAMGAAAAHALDLAGAGSVHQIDIAALQSRLGDNLTRSDRTAALEWPDL